MKVICEYAHKCDNEKSHAIKPHIPINGDRNGCIYPGFEVEQIPYKNYLKNKLKY